MDTLLCNPDGTLLFGDATSGEDTLLSSEETLAFLYTGSDVQTTYTWPAVGVKYADIVVVGGGGGGTSATGLSAPKGGGGGGEVVFRRGVAVTPNTTIKVGRGGPIGTQGGISEFGAIQANGGGAGSSGAGGSGGGADRNITIGGVSSKLSADGWGSVGGVSIAGIVGAAGGGGAMQPGFPVTTRNGSDGGQGAYIFRYGIWSNIYGSGGGGGTRGPTGGVPYYNGLGGPNAGNGGAPGGSGAANTGSGGGGGEGTDTTFGNGGLGGSGIVLIQPNPGILDELGSSVYSAALGAYAMRRLFGVYTGPQIRIRRSWDNLEADIYFDKYGRLITELEGLLQYATGYIVTWYDQGPAAKHTTGYASGGATLPVIYKREDGLYAVSFTGTSSTVGNYFNAGSITFNIGTNGGVSTFSSVNFKDADRWERVYDYANGPASDNLLLARNDINTTTNLELYIGSNFEALYNGTGIVNNTWRTFGCRIQGSGNTWTFLQRVNGQEVTTTKTSYFYGDVARANTYLGRSNWAGDNYSNMYLACQIFFNTGAISSSQFQFMENVLR